MAVGTVAAQPPSTSPSSPSTPTPSTVERKPADKDRTPTENPNATVVPGKMRSDREDVPAGFSKADADKAETMEAKTEQGGAAFADPGCQVYWSAPYEVCGAIKDKYNELGGPSSFLLWPTTNELTQPDGIGKRTVFQNVVISGENGHRGSLDQWPFIYHFGDSLGPGHMNCPAVE